MNNLDPQPSMPTGFRQPAEPDLRARFQQAGITTGRNSLFLILAQTGGKLAGLLLFLLLVRKLTVAEIGQFSFAITFAGVFSVLTDGGISIWMMREVSRRPQEASRWFSTALFARILTFSVSASIGLLLAWATKVPPNTWAILLIFFLAMLPDVMGNTLGYLFLAFERGGASALVTAVTDWLRLLLIALLLRATPNLPRVAWGYLLATLCSPSLFYFALARKRVAWVAPNLDDLKRAVRGGIPFLLVGTLVRVYLRVDTLLLAYLQGDFSVGTYNAAYKLMESLLFIPAAFMGAVFPLLARSFHQDRDQFQVACRMAIRILAAIGFPLAVGTTLIAPQLIATLYGPQYSSSVLYLQVLIWAAALIFLNATLPASLNAVGREKYTLAVVIAGIVLNVVGNLLLIPWLDALGAAIMTVITEVFSTLLYFYFFRCFLFSPGILGLIWRPIVASALMGAVTYWALNWPLPLVIVLGVVCYTLCLAAIGGIRRRELELSLAVLGVSRR